MQPNQKLLPPHKPSLLDELSAYHRLYEALMMKIEALLQKEKDKLNP
jgi:hypothetical protein